MPPGADRDGAAGIGGGLCPPPDRWRGPCPTPWRSTPGTAPIRTVTLLISERTNDGLERAPEQWFRRYNAAAPEQGGARKTEALKPKAWLEEARAAWAAQTNQALERARP